METLNQIKGNEKRKFELQDNGLMITVESVFGIIQRSVEYENISNNFIRYNWGMFNWLVLALVIILILVSGLFLKLFGISGEGRIYYYVIISCIGGLFSLFNLTKGECTIICYDNYHIEFFKDSPSSVELELFIEELRIKRNSTLKTKYAHVTDNVPYNEQLDKLFLLHNLEAIDLNEFQTLKDELEAKFQNKITFSSN